MTLPLGCARGEARVVLPPEQPAAVLRRAQHGHPPGPQRAWRGVHYPGQHGGADATFARNTDVVAVCDELCDNW